MAVSFGQCHINVRSPERSGRKTAAAYWAKNHFDKFVARRLLVRPLLTTMAKLTPEALTGELFSNGDDAAVVMSAYLIQPESIPRFTSPVLREKRMCGIKR